MLSLIFFRISITYSLTWRVTRFSYCRNVTKRRIRSSVVSTWPSRRNRATRPVRLCAWDACVGGMRACVRACVRFANGLLKRSADWRRRRRRVTRRRPPRSLRSGVRPRTAATCGPSSSRIPVGCRCSGAVRRPLPSGSCRCTRSAIAPAENKYNAARTITRLFLCALYGVNDRQNKNPIYFRRLSSLPFPPRPRDAESGEKKQDSPNQSIDFYDDFLQSS